MMIQTEFDRACEVEKIREQRAKKKKQLERAAPDLLAALKGLAEDDLFSSKHMDMALKAIEKAEK